MKLASTKPSGGLRVLLNTEQKAVAEAGPDEWLLVDAGPGTGKTQVAAMRLAYLIKHGLQPAQILVLSFSRSAVATLARRLATLQPDDEVLLEDLRHLAIRTFDSWTFRILRQTGVPVSELLSHSYDSNIARVTALLRGDRTIEEKLTAIRHVIVDEFQDLPGVRAELVISLLTRLNLSKEHRVGFTVLGDPAQAIYRFAARSGGHEIPADPWSELKKEFGGHIREIVLVQNHRSTSELAGMATKLRKILGSTELDATNKLSAMRNFIEGIPLSEGDEKIGQDWISKLPDGSFAVLTRTNGEALQVWKMLMGNEIESPSMSVTMRLAGSVPCAPPWIAALLSRYKFPTLTLKVFQSVYSKTESALGLDVCDELGLPQSELAWRRLVRASGAMDTSTSIDLESLRSRLEWPDSFPDDQVHEQAEVYITTVHQAKGMEFNNVALLESRQLPEQDTSVDPLEEAHINFVAVTRAGYKLSRLPSTCIYKSAGKREFDYGRARQYLWAAMVNLQIGIPGDIDAVSFIDSALHGDEKSVGELQDFLLKHSASIRGCKVVLHKTDNGSDSGRARDARYDIRLQKSDGEGMLLGRTTLQVTRDLLNVVWNPGYSLPGKIFNLRIAEVVTVCSLGDIPETIPDPWRSSRLWLGVTLNGSGDFKPRKRNAK